ncbi:MAG: hypothetical protein M3Y33_14310 [Actinomycetota bacterium]|nr:hypothetical protein [Actinomycetota bacterium]
MTMDGQASVPSATAAAPGDRGNRGRNPWRSGRHVVTAPRLADLHGPASGVVELPHRLLWQADRHVDLDNPALLRWAYQIVLREAVTVDELRSWLDGPTLARRPDPDPGMARAVPAPAPEAVCGHVSSLRRSRYDHTFGTTPGPRRPYA